MTSEERLLAALRRRDPRAFAALFDAYSDKLYRVALGLLADEQEADGVVQDTFLRLFERLDQFEGRARLSTWMYRVATNLAIDRLRRRRPTVPVSLTDDDDASLRPMPVSLADWRAGPEQQLTDDEVRAELDRAIAALPEAYRLVFMLREIEALSTEETAQVLALSAGNVKVRLHRARLFLRERLAERFAELAAG